MGMNGFFLDSYAVIEYIADNPKYIKYFEKKQGMLTYANILEIGFSLLEYGENQAKKVVDALTHLIIQPEKSEIIESILFRKKHIKKRLSYTDCLGYIIAKNRGVRFLTGDKQFKGMDNVEFVK